MKKIMFLLMCLLSAILTACGDDSSSAGDNDSLSADGCTPESCIVYVMYSQAGIGDNGFQDMVYYGVNHFASIANFVVDNISPASKKMAEEGFKIFFEGEDADKYKRRLLIVTTGEFDSLLLAHKNWKQSEKNSVLILESPKDSIDAHFWDISLYGASYLAGRVVGEMDFIGSTIVAANPKTKAVQDAVNGYVAGYSKESKQDSINYSVEYIADEDGEGFDNPEEAFTMGLAFYKIGFPVFIYPVIGGSSEGLYRFMREKQDSLQFFSCGMDADREYESDNIPFSIIKRVDFLVMDYLSFWVKGEELEKEYIATLSESPDYLEDSSEANEFVYITVSDGYEEWKSLFDKYIKEAQKAELKYLESVK